MDESNERTPPTTTESGRVSAREKIGLGFGRAVADGTHGTLYVLTGPIYNMTLGLDPRLISTISLIQRLWDAMLDPAFGQFSDNYRSRWGRRRPLMLLGAVPLAVFFVALWWFPRQADAGYLFWYLLIVSLLFYAAHSLFSMPLGGLIVEATDDSHERTRLAGSVLAYGFAAQIGSQWVWPMTQRLFPDPITGVRMVSIGVGIAFLVMGAIPVILCRERLYAKIALHQAKVNFVDGLRMVRGNRSFLALLGARAVFSFGFNVVGALSNYMYVYYVYGGDKKASSVNAAIMGSGYHVLAILTSLWIFPRIERRVGKRRTLQLAAATLVVGCALKLVLYHPGQAYLPFIVVGINGIANAGVSLMAVAMLGDVADQDEYTTGLRREGLFTSLLSWFDKAGSSVGTFLTGFLLTSIGFDAKKGTQGTDTLEWMKISYALAPAAGAVLALIIVGRYALSDERMQEIKQALALRRAAKGESVPSAV